MFLDYDTPEELLEYMSDFDYKIYDVLMNPVDVYIYGEGSCHDQVLFEIDMLELMGIKPESKFLMAVDKDNVGGETHSFVYWVGRTCVYWFENAWRDQRGIHEYDSKEHLLDSVISLFKKRNPNQYVYMSDFNPDEHTIGEDLDTFVSICMENASLV